METELRDKNDESENYWEEYDGTRHDWETHIQRHLQREIILSLRR